MKLLLENGQPIAKMRANFIACHPTCEVEPHGTMPITTLKASKLFLLTHKMP